MFKSSQTTVPTDLQELAQLVQARLNRDGVQLTVKVDAICDTLGIKAQQTASIPEKLKEVALLIEQSRNKRRMLCSTVMEDRCTGVSDEALDEAFDAIRYLQLSAARLDSQDENPLADRVDAALTVGMVQQAMQTLESFCESIYEARRQRACTVDEKSLQAEALESLRALGEKLPKDSPLEIEDNLSAQDGRLSLRVVGSVLRDPPLEMLLCSDRAVTVLNSRGMTAFGPFVEERVEVPALPESYQRKQGEMLLTISADDFIWRDRVRLAVPPGYVISSLSVADGSADISGVEILQNEVGDVSLRGLPRTSLISYLCTQLESPRIVRHESWMLDYFAPTRRAADKVYAALVRSQATMADKIEMISERFGQVFSYSDSVKLKNLLRAAPNLFDALAEAKVGSCDELSKYFCNELRRFGIYAYLRRGNFISKRDEHGGDTSEGLQITIGHVIVCYLDENGHEHSLDPSSLARRRVDNSSVDKALQDGRDKANDLDGETSSSDEYSDLFSMLRGLAEAIEAGYQPPKRTFTEEDYAAMAREVSLKLTVLSEELQVSIQSGDIAAAFRVLETMRVMRDKTEYGTTDFLQALANLDRSDVGLIDLYKQIGCTETIGVELLQDIFSERSLSHKAMLCKLTDILLEPDESDELFHNQSFLNAWVPGGRRIAVSKLSDDQLQSYIRGRIENFKNCSDPCRESLLGKLGTAVSQMRLRNLEIATEEKEFLVSLIREGDLDTGWKRTSFRGRAMGSFPWMLQLVRELDPEFIGIYVDQIVSEDMGYFFKSVERDGKYDPANGEQGPPLFNEVGMLTNEGRTLFQHAIEEALRDDANKLAENRTADDFERLSSIIGATRVLQRHGIEFNKICNSIDLDRIINRCPQEQLRELIRFVSAVDSTARSEWLSQAKDTCLNRHRDRLIAKRRKKDRAEARKFAETFPDSFAPLFDPKRTPSEACEAVLSQILVTGDFVKNDLRQQWNELESGRLPGMFDLLDTGRDEARKREQEEKLSEIDREEERGRRFIDKWEMDRIAMSLLKPAEMYDILQGYEPIRRLTILRGLQGFPLGENYYYHRHVETRTTHEERRAYVEEKYPSLLPSLVSSVKYALQSEQLNSPEKLSQLWVSHCCYFGTDIESQLEFIEAVESTDPSKIPSLQGVLSQHERFELLCGNPQIKALTETFNITADDLAPPHFTDQFAPDTYKELREKFLAKRGLEPETSDLTQLVLTNDDIKSEISKIEIPGDPLDKHYRRNQFLTCIASGVLDPESYRAWWGMDDFLLTAQERHQILADNDPAFAAACQHAALAPEELGYRGLKVKYNEGPQMTMIKEQMRKTREMNNWRAHLPKPAELEVAIEQVAMLIHDTDSFKKLAANSLSLSQFEPVQQRCQLAELVKQYIPQSKAQRNALQFIERTGKPVEVKLMVAVLYLYAKSEWGHRLFQSYGGCLQNQVSISSWMHGLANQRRLDGDLQLQFDFVPETYIQFEIPGLLRAAKIHQGLLSKGAYFSVDVPYRHSESAARHQAEAVISGGLKRVPLAEIPLVPMNAQSRKEGEHTPIRSASGDPDSIREYMPGDSTKAIDWKLTARSGRITARLSTEPSRHRETMYVIELGISTEVISQILASIREDFENKREFSTVFSYGGKVLLHLTYRNMAELLGQRVQYNDRVVSGLFNGFVEILALNEALGASASSGGSRRGVGFIAPVLPSLPRGSKIIVVAPPAWLKSPEPAKGVATFNEWLKRGSAIYRAEFSGLSWEP